jgi:hypothetical protein
MPTELVSFNGSQFVGKPLLADIEFVPMLEKLNKFAEECGLLVHVTSSARQHGITLGNTIVPPASRSNHLVGHGIDMNLKKGQKYFNSTALSKKNLSKQPKAVQKFIQSIRTDSILRWGGDFNREDPVHIDDNLNNRDPILWEAKFRIIQADLNGLTRPSAEPGVSRLLFLERPFMKGPDVLALQERLVALGFEMNPDGEFGPMTDAAVTEFQLRNGFEPDGIVGKNTRKALKL